jgi:hypothetical protein
LKTRGTQLSVATPLTEQGSQGPVGVGFTFQAYQNIKKKSKSW